MIYLLIALAAITLPLWLDHVLPHLNPYLRAVTATAGRWSDVLKGIAGK